MNKLIIKSNLKEFLWILINMPRKSIKSQLISFNNWIQISALTMMDPAYLGRTILSISGKNFQDFQKQTSSLPSPLVLMN